MVDWTRGRVSHAAAIMVLAIAASGAQASTGRVPASDVSIAMQRWGQPAESQYREDTRHRAAATSASAATGFESPDYPAETGGRDHNPAAHEYQVGRFEGERIDPRTLSLSWHAEDIRLPGNAGMDLVVSRTHGAYPHSIPMEVGNWHLDVPRISIPTSPYQAGLWYYADGPWYLLEVMQYFYPDGSWSPNRTWPGICNSAHELALHQNFVKNASAGPSGTVAGYLYAAPVTMYIPGEGAMVLLEPLEANRDQFPAGADFVTTDNWYIECTSPKPAPDYSYMPLPGYMGGFRAHAPDGRVYTFDWMQWYQPGETNFGAWGGQVHLVARTIEDAHGNRIYLDYDLASGLLMRMTGYDRTDTFDGRQVDFYYDGAYPYGLVHPDNWSGAHLKRAMIVDTNNDDGGDTSILYSYCGRFSAKYPDCSEHNDGNAPQILHEVRLPDGLRWAYEARQVIGSGRPTANWALTKVILPTNAQVEYEYLADIDNANNFLLKKRTVRGVDIPTSVWNYDYSLANHIEATTITGPDKVDRYQFYEGVDTLRYQYAHRQGNYSIPPEYSTLAGRLKSHVIESTNNEPVRRTDFSYGVPQAIGKYWYANHLFGNHEIIPVAYTHKTLLTERVVSDAASGLQYRTSIDIEDYDVFGMPLVVDEVGDDGAVEGDDFVWKQTTYAYAHNESPWLVGLVDSVSVWGDTIDYDYGALGNVERIDHYGVVNAFEYTPNGNLRKHKWTRDGIPHEIVYTDYHRGKAQHESHPVDVPGAQFVTLRRRVDDFGRTLWQEDGEGNRTDFAFDAAGRLRLVDPPLYAESEFSYLHNAGDRWTQTKISRGGYERRISLDTLGRQKLVREFDGQHPDEPPVATAATFDAVGRVAALNAPFWYLNSASVANAPTTRFEYDALGRVQRQINPDGSVATWCYQPSCNTGDYTLLDATLENGFIVTDERGFQTGYEYLAYGNPDNPELTRIAQQVSRATDPGGAKFIVTRIGRTKHGKIDFVTQSDGQSAELTRDYKYNDANQLRKITQPETGATTFSYDEVGNRKSTKIGTSAPIRFGYDGRNRLTRIDYPGNTPDVEFEWYATDRLKSSTNSTARWDYTYTPTNRISKETLRVGPDTYELTHFYNSQGDETGLRYPNGEIASLAADDLGRPRRVGRHVTDVSYWPNGMPRATSFANGVMATTTLNQRQLPEYIEVRKDAGAMLSLEHNFDATQNVAGIDDGVVWNNDQTMVYDGVGRLIRADGYWGSGEIAYDAVGNIRSKTIGDQALAYAYNPLSNLLETISEPGEFAVYQHDVRGNVVADGTRNYVYNSASQLTAIDQLPDLAFAYDGNGMRVIENRSGNEIITGYDLSGQLMFENRCAEDNTELNYFYLDQSLVAQSATACDVNCHT